MADEEELGSGVSTADRHASAAAAASPPEKLPPYDAVRTAMQDAALGKKKPSTSKVALLLRALTYYKLDNDLADVIFQILDRYVVNEKDDEKRRQLLPYIHYLLVELSPYEPRPFSWVRDTLSKETKVGVALNRRLPALRTYGLWAENSPWQETLSEQVSKLELEPEGKKKEKTGLFSLGGSKKEWSDAAERADLQALLLSAARARPRRSPLQRPPLLEALRSDEVLAVRHAAALLLASAPEEASAIAPQMRPLIPHLRQKDAVLLTDVLARVYWTRLCGILSHTDGDVGEEFGQAVLQSLVDVSDRVFLEALAVLRLPPTRLHTDAFIVISSGDGKESRINALREAHVRINDLLDAASPPSLVHAVCRALANLAEAYSPLPDISAYTSLSLHPLFPALMPLGQVASRAAPHVRLMALKAALWLPTRHASAEVESLLIAEFRRPSPLPPRLLTDLFRELLRRLNATPWVYGFVLRLIHVLFLARPDLLAHVPLPDLWRSVVSVSEPARAAALASLWALLDVPPAPQHRLAIYRVYLRIYHFLGSHAVQLTSVAPAPALPTLSAALHALLLRLEMAVVHGAPETAAVAVEALLQVALTHGADVRLRVFQFLGTCKRHTALLQPAAAQALHLLDRLLSTSPPPDLAALSALLGTDVRLTA